MNADGTDQINLTNDPVASDAGPAWSPNGRQIAFASNAGGRHGIFVMNADGTGVVRLTENQAVQIIDGMPVPASDVDPSWGK